MESCNLINAVAYIENLHKSLLSRGKVDASNHLSGLVTSINESRRDIALHSSTAGAASLNIYNSLNHVFEPAKKPKVVQTSKKQEPVKQKEEPTYETIAGFKLGEVKEIGMSEFVDLLSEIAQHADSNRFDGKTSSVQEDLASMSTLLKTYLKGKNSTIKVELTNQVIASVDGGTREALGKYNKNTGVLSIAVNPKSEKLSKESLLISTGKIMLHELVHAMTVQFLADNPDVNRRVEALRVHAVNMYKAENGGKEPNYAPGSAVYGLKNTAEFVAEVVTSGKLKELLAGYSATKTKNIYSRVLAIFNKMVSDIKATLGIPTDSYTLLDESVELVSSILGDDYETLLKEEKEVVETVTGIVNPVDKEPVGDSGTESGYTFKKGGSVHTTNRGQTVAIDAMKLWFGESGPDKRHFLLQGRGGTGKTTVINVLLEELGIRPEQVMFAADMHKAKQVLIEANEHNRYKDSEYTTVASILALLPDGRGGFKRAYGKKPKSLPKVLVVDEASVLKSEYFNSLVTLAEKYGTRIIFMGDNAQMPPVADPDPEAQIKATVFSKVADSTTHLNELMRQGKESPIITVTNDLIDLVNYVEKDVESSGKGTATTKNAEEAVNNLFKFNGDFFGKYDVETGEGVIVTQDDFDSVIEHLVNDLKHDNKGTKYIHYYNHVNPKSIAKTDQIRQRLYSNAEKESFIEGEPLVLNNPYTLYGVSDGDRGDMVLNNSEEFEVVSSELVNKPLHYKVEGIEYQTTDNVEMHVITAFSKTRNSEFTFHKPTARDAKSIQALINKLVSKETGKIERLKSGGVVKYAVKEALSNYMAKDLSHYYVINTHKAQGSSYENVYMDAGNILNLSSNISSANVKAKSMYVAASRPKKKLVVIDNRYNGSVVNGATLDNIPTVNHAFKDTNTAETANIVENVTNCKGLGE
jgi:hypothetical protein